MPHQTLKLIPGVDQNKTPTLNEAAVSSCNLIRYMRDRTGAGLFQKLGGWSRFYANAMPAIVRALWAWQDTQLNKRLAVGCEVGSDGSALLVITESGSVKDITPHVLEDNVTVDVTTTIGSNVVRIGDPGSNINSYSSVFIPAHISVGGVIIFGFYQAALVSANSYDITLTDALGNPVLATAAVVSGGAVAVFDSTSGSSVITVTLTGHGYQVGDTYPVLISTAVGGVTLSGNYLVQTVPTANTFTIIGPSQASSTTTVSINSGKARYDYYLTFGPLPAGSGFGIGGFGRGGFGTGVMPGTTTGSNIQTLDWVLANWGEILLALPTDMTFGSINGSSYVGGPLYYWSPQQNTDQASVIPQAPRASTDMFVAMPQRQVILLGTTDETGVQDPLLIRYCDVNNFFSWISEPTNLVGRYRLTRGSRIVGGLQGPQQGLIWTDLGLWAMQFIGGDNAYGFNEIASGCGMMARKAAGILGGTVYWLGVDQFFKLDAGVEIVPCPIWDVIFQNLNTSNLRKIRCAVNSSFNEIAWYYPSANGGGEIDSYVKYNPGLGDGGWDYGSLSRTAWINQSPLGQPIGADGTNKVIYQHEISNDADGAALDAWFQTGYFTLMEGDVITFLDQLWPDMKWGQYGSSANAQVAITFYVADTPDDTPTVFGPYTLSQAVKYITPRLRGRLVSLKFENIGTGTFWRLGAPRYRYAPDGKF